MSPTIFKKRPPGFFSREESRKHVHIFSPDGEAKLYGLSKARLCNFFGLDASGYLFSGALFKLGRG